MRTYHFIKYDANTSLDNLLVNSNCQTTICFDFEDSIQDCIEPSNTDALKENHRKHFKSIIDKNQLNQYKIGVRINPIDSKDFQLDIQLLYEIDFVSVLFLPKVSQSIQLQNLEDELNEIGLSYDEIIPVIETKNGMDNLDEILSFKSQKISGIAFGHCDFNLDCQFYPFYHQDSREYWTWVAKIYQNSNTRNLRLINSPFLELNDFVAFKNVLATLYAIGGENLGQITLSKEQTDICNLFSENQKHSSAPKLSNRLDQRVPDSYAKKFIESFQQNNRKKGFAINGNKVILSPQEYLASLHFQQKKNYPEINFTFVGGCFAVQSNITFENLFHQVLKRQIENEKEVIFNVNSIRYERFKNCTSKISTYNSNHPIDILVFSIRPEPFLRLVKFYFKYFDSESGENKGSFNIPSLNKLNPEKHDLLTLSSAFTVQELTRRSKFYNILIDLNYSVGWFFGNNRHAQRNYLKLVNEVIDFCQNNKIKLIILGPPMRNNTLLEGILSKRLGRFMKKKLLIPKENFVDGSDQTADGELLFKNNGIFATEKYHALIASRILEKLFPFLN